jgi:hypothetical protein
MASWRVFNPPAPAIWRGARQMTTVRVERSHEIGATVEQQRDTTALDGPPERCRRGAQVLIADPQQHCRDFAGIERAFNVIEQQLRIAKTWRDEIQSRGRTRGLRASGCGHGRAF